MANRLKSQQGARSKEQRAAAMKTSGETGLGSPWLRESCREIERWCETPDGGCIWDFGVWNTTMVWLRHPRRTRNFNHIKKKQPRKYIIIKYIRKWKMVPTWWPHMELVTMYYLTNCPLKEKNTFYKIIDQIIYVLIPMVFTTIYSHYFYYWEWQSATITMLKTP